MESKLKIKVLTHTPEGGKIIAMAGRVCYSNCDFNTLEEKITSDEVARMINKLISSGHHSTIEHVSFTFAVEGVSRALSHQLVRARIASYSQRSQRYIKEKAFDFIVPNSIKNNGLEEDFLIKMAIIQEWYNEYLKAGIPAEDARFLLPNACETKLIFTFNARSLLNFFQHRLCRRAQWEIREMAFAMLREVIAVEPILGEALAKVTLPCVYDRCDEGSMTCGKPYTEEEVREKCLR